MPPMSEDRDAQDLDDAGTSTTDVTCRLLEDPGSLIVGPYGPVAQLGPHVLPPEKQDLDGVRWWRCRLQYLIWNTAAAKALLSGALVTDLLGCNYVLLDGRHRPVWHPCPGVDAPDLAFFPDPPDNMSATDLMVRLVATIRR